MTKDVMTGEQVRTTICLANFYPRHLKAFPRAINDFFQRRRKRKADDSTQFEMNDIILCQVGPGHFVVTAAVQIPFLQMVHSIQLLEQMVLWLPDIIKDQKESNKKRQKERQECKAQNKVYKRHALNQIKHTDLALTNVRCFSS